MAAVHDYKRLENGIVQRVKHVAASVAGSAAGFFRAFFRILNRRYTVVFVPHSEKRVYNLHITVLSMCCFLLVLSGILAAFFWYGASYSGARGLLESKDGRLQDIQANLDQLRDETSRLLREAREFETALSGTLSALGADVSGTGAAASSESYGDLSSFFDINETPAGNLREVDDVRRLSAYLASAREPVREIGTLLDSQSALLTEIPSIWPI
ncbi:MAG: M23 family peptidase, partial [Treponema sp.]|nr:M23 family peptidase [Treponema sp.]